MIDLETLRRDDAARLFFLRDSDEATLTRAALGFFRQGDTLRALLDEGHVTAARHADLEASLHLCCSCLHAAGERRMEAIEACAGEERQKRFQQLNGDAKFFARSLESLEDLLPQLPRCTREELVDTAIFGAQAFAGGNPAIEMNPGSAQARRLDAFDLAMRALQELSRRD
ncbi:MAG: hypothetical protein RL095_3112 [Verrucomicrobiota bacterium]|jgi:hypothetical protein